MSDMNPDRFVHKQYPWVREQVVAKLADYDYDDLIQYLKDQGIEVR